MEIDYKSEYKALEKEADRLLHEVVGWSVKHSEDLERIKVLQEENARLRALVEAARNSRCVVLPYECGDKIYVIDDRVKKGYRTTKLNYYQIYADGTDRNIIVKTKAVEHWYDLSEIFSTLEEVKVGIEKAHQKKRESCLKYGCTCRECKNDYCNARGDAAVVEQNGGNQE